jgi:hypothetical protein
MLCLPGEEAEEEDQEAAEAAAKLKIKSAHDALEDERLAKEPVVDIDLQRWVAGCSRVLPLMLCCAVLCCAVPCRAVPCRAVPCRAVPSRAAWSVHVLFCEVLRGCGCLLRKACAV